MFVFKSEPNCNANRGYMFIISVYSDNFTNVFCRIKQIGIRNVRTQQKQNGEPTQNITGDSITD